MLNRVNRRVNAINPAALVNTAVNQLLYTPLSILVFIAMGGDAVITCCEVWRDWLQLRLMNKLTLC